MAVETTFLGLDIGTSSVKAILIDERQTPIAESSEPLEVSRPHPLWSEQDPELWVSAVHAAVNGIRESAAAAFHQLSGIGLSGQMHGATFLDAADKPLRPAILWNDGRSGKQCIELERSVPDFRRRAGNIAMPGFTAPKVLWVREHEPEIFRATARVLLPKDYVRLKLSGEAVSEMSDASGTLWLDIANRAWDDDLVAASGLTLRHLPRLVEGSEVSAHLSSSVAAAWGLSGRKIPIAGGGGDNAASAVGIGATKAGEGFVSLGTSGVIFAVTDKYVSHPERTLHAFCHALPGRWHGMSVMLSAASSLSWIAEIGGKAGSVGALAEAAERFAAKPGGIENAPIFLPYLSGERTPHNDPEAAAVFVGLRAEHDLDAMAFAVMEGVAFSFADGADVLREAGASLGSMLLVGGGVRSTFWGQMIADVAGLTLGLPTGAETGAAQGAARLGMLAAGAGDEASVCTRPPLRAEFRPRAETAARHAPRLKRYRALYPAERTTRS